MNQKLIKLEERSFCAESGVPCQFLKLRSTGKSARILLAVALAGFSAARVWAQGDIPSGTISSSGSGPYTYDVTFTDSGSATSPIGSIWYSWVPGQFFLPGIPTTASAPTGWSADIFDNSIQFVASSSIYDITAGSSLSGFSYQASFSPATLAATPNSGESVAYVAGLQTDNGMTFTVRAVPEPSSAALLGMSALGLALARWRKLRVKE